MVEQRATIDFSRYITDRTQNFTGREWVFQAINDWLADPEAPRFFLITGEPGSGKSAIAARLHQFSLGEGFGLLNNTLTNIKPGFLSASYFCSARDNWSTDPRTFTESLASQLASNHPIYKEALAKKISSSQIQINVNLENVQAQNVTGVIVRISGDFTETSFNQVIREPLETMYRENQSEMVVILVDALDEALTYSGKANIVSLLARLDNLPTGVHFIVTSRRVAEVESRFSQTARMLFISDSRFNRTNHDDISRYIRKRFAHENDLASKIAGLEPQQVDEITSKIASKAEGNFLYVRFLFDATAKGQQGLSELDKLPAGLDNLYHDSLGRMITPEEWSREYAPLVGILSVAQDSLTESQLQNFTGLSERIVSSHLRTLQQFIEYTKAIEVDQTIEDAEQHKYKLYHQSFVDFLRRKFLTTRQNEGNEIRNTYYLPPDEWHKTIADYYRAGFGQWREVDWSKVDEYGLLHLASHLSALINNTQGNSANKYRQELYGLICKSFMQAKLERYASYYFFVKDVELAFEAAHSEQPSNLLQLVRMNLLISTIQIFVNEIPSQAFSALTLIGKDGKALGFAALMPKGSSERIEVYVQIGQALLHRQEICKAINVLVQLFAENDDSSSVKFYLTRLVPFIAQVRELDQLVKIAKAIATDKSQEYWWILSSVALELAFEDKDKKAIEVMERIDNLNANARALGIIAQTFSRKGKTVRARETINQILELAKSIEDTLSKAQALSEMAGALVEIGEKEKITDIIRQMRAMTRRTTEEQDKGNILSLLAVVLAQSSKRKELDKISLQVQRIAEGVKDESIRENMLNRIVVGLDLINEHEASLRVGRLTKYHTDTSNVRGSEGRYVTIQPNDPEEVSIISTWEPWMPSGVKFVQWDGKVDYHRTYYLGQGDDIEKALVKAEEGDELHKANALSNIAELLFLGTQRNSFFSAALLPKGSIAYRMQEIAETISNEKYKPKALGAVALAFAIENMDSGAEEMANKALKAAGTYEYHIDINSKERALAAIAKTLAQYQKFDEAQKIAAEIKDILMKADVRKVIVRELAKTNQQHDKAIEVANQILSMTKGTGYEPSTRAIAIEALTWAGKVKQALEMVQELNLTKKTDLLVDMALALAELGKIRESIKLAKMAQALTGVKMEKLARAFAKAYDFDEALETIRKIENKELQMKALADAACALMKAGNKVKAKEIADQAWSAYVECALTMTVRNNQYISTPKLSVDSLTWVEAGSLLFDPEGIHMRWEPNSTVQAIFPLLNPPGIEEALGAVDQELKGKGGTINDLGLVSHYIIAYFLTISGQVEKALSLFIKTLILVHDKFLEQNFFYLEAQGQVEGAVRSSKLSVTYDTVRDYAPLIASVDQGQTLWKIYEAIVEMEDWWAI
jgi:tetratricopeptide (TPR) repeat protein